MPVSYHKNQVLTANVNGETTTIKLLSHPNKSGQAVVKILEAGIIEAKEGHVIKWFELTHGCIKDWKVVPQKAA